jgi:hypothetical protein
MMHHLPVLQSNILLIAVCLLSLTGFMMAMPSPVAAADIATQAARNEGDAGANSHDLVQGGHVEGHIAFLRAELGITPAQEPLWAPVAAAMHEDVRKLRDAERNASQKQRPDNAVDYLENRVVFANLRAEGEARFLTAFKPLYDSLSPQQKQVADGLLIPNAPE